MKAWQKLLAASLLMITCMVFFAKGVLAVECCTLPDKLRSDGFCSDANSWPIKGAIKKNNCVPKIEKCYTLTNQCVLATFTPPPTATPTTVTVPAGTQCCLGLTQILNEYECRTPGPLGIKIPNQCKGGKCNTVTKECTNTGVFSPTTSPYDPCKNTAPFTAARTNCLVCNTHGTWTAIGCLENDPPKLVGQLIGIGGGIAGGIAFLLMLWGAAQLVLSQGIPEKIQAAKDTITSAVIGLVFIFLSVLILKLIGVQMLGIPGWS